MACSPITSWQIDQETVGTGADFIFWGSKITADSDCSHEIKRYEIYKKRFQATENSAKHKQLLGDNIALNS